MICDRFENVQMNGLLVVTTAYNFVLVASCRRQTEVQLPVILDNILSRDHVNLGLWLTRQGHWDNVKKLSVFLLKWTVYHSVKWKWNTLTLGFPFSLYSFQSMLSLLNLILKVLMKNEVTPPDPWVAIRVTFLNDPKSTWRSNQRRSLYDYW